MGYLYLALALFGGVSKGLCGKKVSGDMHSFRDCLFINGMRMLFCLAIGFAMVLVQGDMAGLALTAESFGIYMLSAVGMTVFCVCWMYAYRTEAYIFLNIFTMLGTIITCILGFIFYDEPIRWNQWLGMVILLGAVMIMSKYNRELKGKFTLKGILILILGCTGSAVADFSQKVYMAEVGESAAVYNFYGYGFGFVMLAIAMIVMNLLGDKTVLTPAVTSKKNVFIYFAMSACLFLNTTTKTLAAGLLSTAQIYPVLQGANLIVSILMAHILFHERINWKSIAGICCAFAGLMVMRML